MNEINRREFLNIVKRVLATTGLLAVAAPVVAYFYPPKLEEIPSEPVLVCPENELPVGESKTVRFGRYPAIVLNTKEGLKAFSAVCTHFACIVKWNPDLGLIVCPCHEGYFDPIDGHVISGPPPTSLALLRTEVVDGTIYVGGAE
jgi:Rieske Fe-S protein